MSRVDNKQLLGWVIAQQHKHLEDVERASKRFDRERRASVEATREELLSFASKASYMKRKRQNEIERVTRLKRLGILFTVVMVPLVLIVSLAYFIYQGSNLAKIAQDFFAEEPVEYAQASDSDVGLSGRSDPAASNIALTASPPDTQPSPVLDSSRPIDKSLTRPEVTLGANKEGSKTVESAVVKDTSKEVKNKSDLASVYPLPPLGVPNSSVAKDDSVRLKDKSKQERAGAREERPGNDSAVVAFKLASKQIDLKTLKPGDYIAPAGAREAQSERVLSVFTNGDVLTDLRMIDANKVKFFEIRG